MPLPTPVLDDRTFDQLVEQARARIPRYTPEWTNFNDSDPGMTLVKLHAWLTETILFRLNRLPDLNYIKFLELLNIQPRPAIAARAQLTFKLKKLNATSDPLVVLIPKNTQVGVDDPDLPEKLVFETDRTLTALNAALASILIPGSGTDIKPATEFDPDQGTSEIPRPFYPFGATPQVGDVCLLGFVLRPQRKSGTDYSLDRFPTGELDLTVLVPQVLETGADQTTISGPEGMQCLFPWQVTALGQQIVWEAFTGTQPETQITEGAGSTAWTALKTADETAALARSGHIYLDVPGGLPVVAFSQFSRAFWTQMGLRKPPTTKAELVDDLNDFLDPKDIKEADWVRLGLTDPDLDDESVLITQINDPATVLDFNALEEKKWTDAGYSAQPVPYPLTWFRLRLEALPDEAPQVSQLLINTVSATAAVTRVDELVGISDGRPNQTVKLRHAPVLVDSETYQPELDLVLKSPGAQGDLETWNVVGDFYGQGADSAVYLLDPQTGTLTFGDGVHGRIPVANMQYIARSYRVGGGAVGNAGPGTITKLVSVISDVDSVTNLRAAQGGQDAEALEEVKLRAPHDLRMRDRAVTADDFAQLARQTPGVPIQRAYALAETRLDTGTTPPTPQKNAPGAVTVVILPESKADAPQPSEDQLRLVCAHLDARRLITTELYVIGPRYKVITALNAELLVSRQADLKTVRDAARQKLLDYFHPLHGGEDQSGWPFAQDAYFGNVYRQLLTISGLLNVLCLTMQAGTNTAVCTDVLTLDDFDLFSLSAEAIDLKVTYDPYR